MRHFEKELNSHLPAEAPWKCPVERCPVEDKDNLYYLRLHYGIEHNVARKLYNRKFDPQPPPPPLVETAPNGVTSPAGGHVSSPHPPSTPPNNQQPTEPENRTGKYPGFFLHFSAKSV